MSTEKKEFKLCKKCHAHRTPEEFLNDKGRTLKTCTHCREYAKKLRTKNICEHNKSKYTCKICKDIKKGTGVIKEDSTNIKSEQSPIVNNGYNNGCNEGCPYCIPGYCNIHHPDCICKGVRHIVVKKKDKDNEVTHQKVKKAYGEYIKWVNKTSIPAFEYKEVCAMKSLRKF